MNEFWLTVCWMFNTWCAYHIGRYVGQREEFSWLQRHGWLWFGKGKES